MVALDRYTAALCAPIGPTGARAHDLTGGLHQVTRTARLGRSSAIITTVVMFLGVLTSCTDGDADDLPEPASDGPPGPTSTIDPVRQAILDVYSGSVQAAVVAQRAGDRDHPDLAEYFGGNTPALFDVQEGIDRHDDRGTRYEGDLQVVTAEVTEFDPDAEPPVATIEACLDDTNYQLVYREDGSPVPDTQSGGRYTATSTASSGQDGKWYIVQSVANWDDPC